MRDKWKLIRYKWELFKEAIDAAVGWEVAKDLFWSVLLAIVIIFLFIMMTIQGLGVFNPFNP